LIRKLVTALLIALIAAMMAAGTSLAQPAFEPGPPGPGKTIQFIATDNPCANAADKAAVIKEEASSPTGCGVFANDAFTRSPHF
jgi:hypothetical protein